MKRLWLSLLVLSSSASAAGWREYSFANIPTGAGLQGWQEVAFWCDTPGRVLAVTAPARPQGPTTLAQWVGGKLTTRPFFLGLPDPGAGNIYLPLTPAGEPIQPTSRYFILYSNVENVGDPAYRMTHINEFRIPAGTFRCRYVPQAAVLAATARRGVTVWDSSNGKGGGRVTYASRNRDGTPGVQLTGGRHTRNAQGQEKYVWTRGPYRYVLEVGHPDRTPHVGGSLSVLRGGDLLSREPLLAYTVSVPR